ncbi:phosphopantetheine-binding protein [Nonomuraea jabiensis]|uniref:phosphopantetheine-binding protein n=1 Tax=Nonomuraea jabiensis TaxID=882448 RepID=UPI0028AC7588|nr:phosphopantetheine-binding protein [Nonomuraea jabiensis]
MRKVVEAHAGIDDASGLSADSDLWAAGMTSLASVRLLLALEDEFSIEFEQSKLSADTLRSLHRITAEIQEAARDHGR